MASRRPLSKGELEVARVLWRLGQATVRQVYEAMPPERLLDFTTVQTYLRRLDTKGYLRTKQQGRAKVYVPKVRPTQVIRETVEDLIGRLFDGETLPLFRHLILDRGITDDEMKQLRTILKQSEQDPNAS